MSKFLKIRLTKEQVSILRRELNCYYRPVTFCGGIMYHQGRGWYEVSTNPQEWDWMTSEQMIKVFLKKINSILHPKAEEPAVIDYSRINVGKRFIDAGLPIYVNSTPKPISAQPLTFQQRVENNKVAAKERLEALQRRINNRFHQTGSKVFA